MTGEIQTDRLFQLVELGSIAMHVPSLNAVTIGERIDVCPVFFLPEIDPVTMKATGGAKTYRLKP